MMRVWRVTCNRAALYLTKLTLQYFVFLWYQFKKKLQSLYLERLDHYRMIQVILYYRTKVGPALSDILIKNDCENMSLLSHLC